MMDAFPFTKTEWEEVSHAAFPLVNATFSNDAPVQNSHFVELQQVLAALRARYGEHPVLLETEADFAEDDHARASLYQRAIAIAEQNGLPTL